MYEVDEKFRVASDYLEARGFRPVRRLSDVEIVGSATPLGYSTPILQDAWFVRFPITRMANRVLVSTPEIVLRPVQSVTTSVREPGELVQSVAALNSLKVARRTSLSLFRYLLRKKKSAYCWERFGSGRTLIVIDGNRHIGVSSHLMLSPLEAAEATWRIALSCLISLLVFAPLALGPMPFT